MTTHKLPPIAPLPVISEREAARLAKHFFGLEQKRLELGRQVSLLSKEQEAIKTKIGVFVRDAEPKKRVVTLAKAVLKVATIASCRFISWKTVCVERLGEAVVAEIEANPPERE